MCYTRLKNPKTWNGLNSPELDLNEAAIAVLGLPYDGATSFRKGAAEAPDRIREISEHIPPTTEQGHSIEKIRVVDLGNLSPEGLPQPDYFKRIESAAYELLKSTFTTFIGGDHSVTIPILHAANKIWGNRLGIIHLDAHLDLCEEIDGNRLSHGCTHRRNLENSKIPVHQIHFIGIRSFETQEACFISNKEFNIYTAADINAQGIELIAKNVVSSLVKCKAVYITIDIDFLDPSTAPGTGTPKPGGFTTRDLFRFLSSFSTLPVIGMDLVEVSPPLDHNDITSFAAQRVITESWGYFLLK
ncbi:MAG: agmatinase [Bacillota bacterium]|nr:agmatinase [Bacillota bacterium]